MGEKINNLEKDLKELEKKVENYKTMINYIVRALKDNDIYMKVEIPELEGEEEEQEESKEEDKDDD